MEEKYFNEEEEILIERLHKYFSTDLKYDYGFKKFKLDRHFDIGEKGNPLCEALAKLEYHYSPHECLAEVKEVLAKLDVLLVTDSEDYIIKMSKYFWRLSDVHHGRSKSAGDPPVRGAKGNTSKGYMEPIIAPMHSFNK